MPIDVRKVIAYVTRRRNGRTELLVFEHRGNPGAGVQVPAGTVEDGETVEAAVVRELEEESGLSGLPMRGPIDVYVWEHPFTHNRYHRHVFHFIAADDTPDTWTINPRGHAEEKNGYTFDFRWIPLSEAATLAVEQWRSIKHLRL